MHLNGDITINLYAITPETQRSKWVAIDADFGGAFEALFELQWELRQDGVDAALEQSRRGGHRWIFTETPLLAVECIPSGKAILFNGRLGVIDLLYEYCSFSLIGSTSSATCRSV
jgi:hypothetical protein